MPDGDHGVMTGWGFLAVRLPLPEDQLWAADRTAILQALGVLDPQGQPTERLEAIKGAPHNKGNDFAPSARCRVNAGCTSC